MSLLDILSRQFDASWQMLSDGAMKCPEEEWKRSGGDDFFIPARLVFHCIQTVDFYTSDDREGFDFNAFGFDWESAPADQLPDRQDVRDYCHRVREQVDEWLEKHGEAGLLSSDSEGYSWFKTRMDRAIYAIRHTQHHTGQLSRELQARGFAEVTWS